MPIKKLVEQESKKRTCQGMENQMGSVGSCIQLATVNHPGRKIIGKSPWFLLVM